MAAAKTVYELLKDDKAGADSFVPAMALVILEAQPKKLVSHLQFIRRSACVPSISVLMLCGLGQSPSHPSLPCRAEWAV